MTTLPRISVIIPTVTGREASYARCLAGYVSNAPGSYELEVVKVLDLPSCGLGWQAGWERCAGDYVHLTCDDIEPRPGWHAPAIEAVERGFLPAPQVYGPGGDPQSLPFWGGGPGPDWTPVAMSALPFASRRQMGRIAPLMTAHYFTDNFFSFRGIRAGWQVKLRPGYCFTHYWEQHKRGAGVPETVR